ncbi:MAG: hypothetical protein ABL307_16985 [Roseitalea porphyridii]|uniref:hypothetical protein n=1 Tax=Roseitalea porphyridii TaxID=1852022 RepID=UPI0032D98D87
MIKTFATTIAASALMMGAAFAQSTALDPEPWPMMDDMEMSDDAMGIFADDEGMVRDFDDFAMRYSEADDDMRAEAKRICEAYAEDDTVTSTRVRNRCLSVIDQ